MGCSLFYRGTSLYHGIIWRDITSNVTMVNTGYGSDYELKLAVARKAELWGLIQYKDVVLPV